MRKSTAAALLLNKIVDSFFVGTPNEPAFCDIYQLHLTISRLRLQIELAYLIIT
jgi:hypothetical protein